MGECDRPPGHAVPFISMRLHADGVNWTIGDFIFAGVIFATVGGLLELAVKLMPNASHRGELLFVASAYLFRRAAWLQSSSSS
ncbi:MAG TPA: hypothetical protein VIK68_02040 [Sphingomicrobium sp.]